DFSTFFFFSSRRRHTRFSRDWSSDVCSSDLSLASRAIFGVSSCTRLLFGLSTGSFPSPLAFFTACVKEFSVTFVSRLFFSANSSFFLLMSNCFFFTFNRFFLYLCLNFRHNESM